MLLPRMTCGLMAVLVAWVATVLLTPRPAEAATAGLTTSGTDFWVAFPTNMAPNTLSLEISGATATSGVVGWPGGGTTPFSVTPGVVTPVTVDASLAVSISDGTVNAGVHITSGEPVSVYGMSYQSNSAGAFVALPTSALGTRYRALAYPTNVQPYASRVMVVGTQAGTTVTVTPQGIVGSRPAGVPYTISLDAGQVYTVSAGAKVAGSNDVTGTLVTSDRPVAVFAGNDCGLIGSGGGCDQQIEQMVPTVAWGTRFFPVRFAKTSGGDPIRVVADTTGTVVRIDGTVVATLAAGETYEQNILTAGGNTAAVLTTSEPVLVAQFMTRGTFVQGATTAGGDPSLMLLPPHEQYLTEYTMANPATRFGFNAVNVVIPTRSAASLRLDGVPVPDSSFAPIGDGTFSSAQLLVTRGTHTLRAGAPFGAFAYGANGFNSYAYPAGAGLAPVASVARVTSPATRDATVGSTVCLTAAATDSQLSPVGGVRVDLTATGANPAATQVTTDASGLAELCYPGTAVGSDTVTLSVGRATSVTTVTWREPTPVPSPTTSTATATPPASPSLSAAPSVEPSGEPSASPSLGPSGEPSAAPSLEPSGEPSASLSASPPLEPSGQPSPSLSAAPPVEPSGQPSPSPSPSPSVEPSGQPSASGAPGPTASPSQTVPAGRRPDAPTQPIATAGDQALEAAWAAPVTHGAPVSGYTVTVTPGNETCLASAAATGCLVGNLQNGRAYTVRVVAHSSAGDSDASVPSEPVTPSAIFGSATRLSCDRTIVAPGGPITLVAHGYRDESTVAFHLYSTPILLGAATVDSGGTAMLRTVVPAGIRGQHLASALGLSPDGVPLSRTFALTVEPENRLATTGAHALRMTLTGLALLLAGAIVRVGSTSRGRSHRGRR